MDNKWFWNHSNFLSTINASRAPPIMEVKLQYQTLKLLWYNSSLITSVECLRQPNKLYSTHTNGFEGTESTPNQTCIRFLYVRPVRFITSNSHLDITSHRTKTTDIFFTTIKTTNWYFYRWQWWSVSQKILIYYLSILYSNFFLKKHQIQYQ